ncbi:MAG: alpha/beta hydrolase [Bacteroidetes bacterium]|nr:alpha/beta hydrolase [Bacteroidota bacterium]
MVRSLWLLLLLVTTVETRSQDSLQVQRKELVYGRKDGLALMMVMQSPARANGKAIISIVSGNWRSSYDMLSRFEEKDRIYLNSGYTVFEVMTSSQPRYAIPDEVEDAKRAVRFVRYNAKEFGIDPDKIGITGLSSGGHLSLMVATADDKQDKRGGDAVDKVSARVQAAAVFYPPTDFLNYGQQGLNTTATQAILVATGLAAAFDFKKWNDTTRTYVSVTDMDAKLNIARQHSPIYSISPDDPPVLIAHGDADRLVPMQQSESFIKKLEESGVPNKFVIKKGGNHGWKNSEVEEQQFVEWFDKYLK